MIFKVKEKLGGIFNPQVGKERLEKLTIEAKVGEEYADFRNSRYWNVFLDIIRKKRQKAEKELSRRNLTQDEIKRVNNQMEVLQDILKDVDAVITLGSKAAETLKKVEARQNARRTKRGNVERPAV